MRQGTAGLLARRHLPRISLSRWQRNLAASRSPGQFRTRLRDHQRWHRLLRTKLRRMIKLSQGQTWLCKDDGVPHYILEASSDGVVMFSDPINPPTEGIAG